MREQELGSSPLLVEATPEDCRALLADARRAAEALEEGQRRRWMLESLRLMESGSNPLLVLRAGGPAAGFVTYARREKDVQVFFCHTSPPYHALEGWLFEAAVRRFRAQGARVVRSNFNWPRPESYRDKALALGFEIFERIPMARESDAAYPVRALPAGVEIRPWADGFEDGVARLLFAEANAVDRRIYPQLQTLAGTRGQLRKQIGGAYGPFLPAFSGLAFRGGRLVGALAAVESAETGILVTELVVAADQRGQGIASALLGRLIRESAELGPRQIELVVNATNQEALRLYKSKGFAPSPAIRQYILC